MAGSPCWRRDICRKALCRASAGASRRWRERLPTANRPEASRQQQPLAGTPQNILPKFAIGQAVAKTITFRIIVTTLDFTTNYIVIGEFATAAGLSTYNLIAGPLFYLAHEAAWNYLGPDDDAIDLARSRRARGKQMARKVA